MNDDEIAAAIDRRFAEVEGRLPPQRLEAIAVESPLTERVRGRYAWNRSLAGVLGVAAVAVAVVALAVSGRPDAAPGHVGDASTSVPPPTSTPAPSSTSSMDMATIEVVRGEGSGEMLIFERLGWVGMCLVGADMLSVAIDPALIDQAAEAAGVEEGWVDVGEFGRFWIGTDLERAAAGIGASMLVVGDQGDPWVRLDGAARRLVAIETPAGRTYWRVFGAVRPCDSPGKPSTENR